MRYVPLALVVLFAAPQWAAAADAAPPRCFNPRFEYRAQPAGYHDVIAQNTIGVHQARVRVTTSCIDLHRADYITLGTTFTCLTRGDPVVASILGQSREHCIVTKIVPVPPAPPPSGN
jgi:hypothetical protein